MTRVDPPRTVVDMYLRRLAATPQRRAFRERDRTVWHELTWQGVQRQVRVIAASLLELGVRPQDRVAIHGDPSVRWFVAALATWRVGAIVTTIHTTSTAAEARTIIEDAGCVVVLTQDETLADHLVHSLDKALLDIILLRGQGEHLISWAELSKRGQRAFLHNPAQLDQATRCVKPHHVAALVYTSGTTGVPKGVMISHESICAVATICDDYIPVQSDDEQLHFLPLSHVYGLVNVIMAMHMGTATAIEPDVGRLWQSFREVRPSFFSGVPRIYEKLYLQLETDARQAGATAYRLFAWARRVAEAWSAASQSPNPPSPQLRAAHRLADRLVLQRVRSELGGRVRAMSSGGAPLPRHILAFFHGAGLLILEGYGMSETASITVVNRLESFRLGSVGRPGKGVELRIAHDGEVLIRGRSVMRGYWQKPDATQHALRGGWLHTGDIGHFDRDGFVFITGRKKNIIVTAGGKNVAPVRVEQTLEQCIDLVSTAVVFGDGRPYCVALLALSPTAVARWAQSAGLDADDEYLTTDPRLHEALHHGLSIANAQLPSHEAVRAFHIMPVEPSPSRGERTTSLKLRRDVLAHNYQAELHALYQ